MARPAHDWGTAMVIARQAPGISSTVPDSRRSRSSRDATCPGAEEPRNPFYPKAPPAVCPSGEDEGPERPAVDPEIAEGARRGDERAVEALVRALTPNLLRLALRLGCDPAQAEDLVSEALYRGVVRLGKLREPARTEAWFRRILVNLWRDSLRRKERRRTTLEDAPEPAAPEDSDPAKEADLAELRGLLARELALLPPVQRAVAVLSLEDGLSVGEIAEALGTTIDRVKASLWHARRRLRERLSRAIGEGE